MSNAETTISFPRRTTKLFMCNYPTYEERYPDLPKTRRTISKRTILGKPALKPSGPQLILQAPPTSVRRRAAKDIPPSASSGSSSLSLSSVNIAKDGPDERCSTCGKLIWKCWCNVEQVKQQDPNGNCPGCHELYWMCWCSIKCPEKTSEHAPIKGGVGKGASYQKLVSACGYKGYKHQRARAGSDVALSPALAQGEFT